MKIREANAADRDEIVELYIRSQRATGLPDPVHLPPAKLGAQLYARKALGRYVVELDQHIVAHGLIEEPNSDHIEVWQQGTPPGLIPSFIELGGAFVDPKFSRQGLWTGLLEYRLQLVEKRLAIPVSATWTQNEHVKRAFCAYGGIEVGQQVTSLGSVSLFVFSR